MTGSDADSRARQVEIAQEALSRAEQGDSVSNYPAIFTGFLAKGIALEEIQPRVNVFTFHAWKAKGRVVKKGEKGVPIVAIIEKGPQADAEGNLRPGFKKSRRTTVFHISQTKPIDAEASD